MSGPEAITLLRVQVPELRLIALTSYETEGEEAQMWRQLTPREFEVLECLTKGLSNKEIAVQMGTAESTIKTHMHSLLQKLGAADRAEAVALAVSERVIRLD